MLSASDPLDGLTTMFRSYIGNLLAPVETFLDIFARDGVMESPYASRAAVGEEAISDALKWLLNDAYERSNPEQLDVPSKVYSLPLSVAFVHAFAYL